MLGLRPGGGFEARPGGGFAAMPGGGFAARPGGGFEARPGGGGTLPRPGGPLGTTGECPDDILGEAAAPLRDPLINLAMSICMDAISLALGLVAGGVSVDVDTAGSAWPEWGVLAICGEAVLETAPLAWPPTSGNVGVPGVFARRLVIMPNRSSDSMLGDDAPSVCLDSLLDPKKRAKQLVPSGSS